MKESITIKSAEMLKDVDGLKYVFEVENTTTQKEQTITCSVELINKVISTASMYVKGRVRL